MTDIKKRPVTAIIVGAGHRAMMYGTYALKKPECFKIVGVADPNPLRREKAAKLFSFGEEMCFASAEALAEKPQLADTIINGTMDQQHIPTALPLLEIGYDMLLEKPFAVNQEEVQQLMEVKKRNHNKVMICHVLRYTPFYKAIRREIIKGTIGDIINIQATEHVSYHHTAISFVRGKWNSIDKCGTSMLLQKSCHDMDLIMWMKSGIKPLSVASFGSNYQFVPEKMPEGAGERCLVDCPIEKVCLYSAKKHYIDHPDRWNFYVWASLEDIENPTIEQKIESLKTDNPFGRCAWRCDNNVVDHQSVVMHFADGCTATLNTIGGSSKPQRMIHIIGTKGEIYGVFDESKFVIRKIDPRPKHEYSEEEVDLNMTGDKTGAFGGHGGGDLRMVGDFVNFVRGEEPSISCTSIEDSINSHLAVFAADQSREAGRVVPLSHN